MIEIQKYEAEIATTDQKVVGYITEGCFNGELKYIISVTEISMPNSIIRGCFIVKPESIKKI
jgi:hypothetical protein